MHIRSAAVVLTVLVGLLGAACTSDAEPEPAPTATDPWRPGEVRDVVRACSAVSQPVLSRLQVRPTAGGPCRWSEDTRYDVDRTLSVIDQVYQPSRTGPAVTATEAARREFATLPDWKGRGARIPVRGVGDQAELVRWSIPALRYHRVLLAVRDRNVIIRIDVTQQAVREKHQAGALPLADIEAGAAGAARDVLTRLGAAAGPLTPPAPDVSEVTRVAPVCGPLGAAAARLVPGITRYDTTPPGATSVAGCHWSENDGERPSLTVDVEAIAPSALTGETATQVATTAFGQWKGDGRPAPKLGDAATVDHFESESGEARYRYLYVRRGNLLVYVSYGRWHQPPVAEMDREVAAIATTVLATQP